MSATPNTVINVTSQSSGTARESNLVINELEADELVFAVVGPVGSGTSWIAGTLEEQARKRHEHVTVEVIKASSVIRNWADQNNVIISDKSSLARAQSLQDAGDKIRQRNKSGVAVQLISAIHSHRKTLETDSSTKSTDVGKAVKRVYILDSLKHPAEVELLRRVYREAFCLIGVVCEPSRRLERLKDAKCQDSTKQEVEKFASRDEDAGIKYGQKVADTFHLADFFVDNTPDRFLGPDRKENPAWDVNDQLGRLFDILTHSKITRPTPSETGMFHAYGAQMRSACLSRQVGAALMDRTGNLMSTGTNEVPRAGGGIYGDIDGFDPEPDDYRCAYSGGYCRNTHAGEEIIHELIERLPELKAYDFKELRTTLKTTSLGRLVEFSRAVHAEMDAILSAARQGASPVGGRLFVTTFPCHYCARHIVSAGIDEVQYIEPYPKSRAFDLHGDAITQSADG